MEYFNDLDPSVRAKAMENLAYELLDSYLTDTDDDVIESRLMETLKGENRPNLAKAYDDWEKHNA